MGPSEAHQILSVITSLGRIHETVTSLFRDFQI